MREPTRPERYLEAVLRTFLRILALACIRSGGVWGGNCCGFLVLVLALVLATAVGNAWSVKPNQGKISGSLWVSGCLKGTERG